MRSLICILLAIQLSISLVVAQITFTREWVNGKRNSPSSIFTPQNSQDYLPCKSLWPAIEILMETERLQQAHCGIRLRPAKYMAHFKDPLTGAINKLQDEESVQFEEDTPSPKNP